MRHTAGFGSRWLSVLCSAAFVALIGVGLGCSNNSNSSGPAAGTFYGLYADLSGAPGTITLNAVSLATAPQYLGSGTSTPVTGTLNFSGQLPINLTGLYLTDTGALSFASAGDTYTFNGQVTLGTASGTSTGPNGAGSFVLFAGATADTSIVYCGGATCDPGPCKTPIEFNLAINHGTALLTVFTAGHVASAVGTRTGDIVNIHVTAEGLDVTVQGTINGGSVGGTWSDNVNNTNGLWNGNTTQCSAPALRSRP